MNPPAPTMGPRVGRQTVVRWPDRTLRGSKPRGCGPQWRRSGHPGRSARRIHIRMPGVKAVARMYKLPRQRWGNSYACGLVRPARTSGRSDRERRTADTGTGHRPGSRSIGSVRRQSVGHLSPPRRGGRPNTRRSSQTAMAPEWWTKSVTAFRPAGSANASGLYNGQRNGRWMGTAAEYIALDVDLVTELPDHVSFAEGATLGIPVHDRAWVRLRRRSSAGQDAADYRRGRRGRALRRTARRLGWRRGHRDGQLRGEGRARPGRRRGACRQLPHRECRRPGCRDHRRRAAWTTWSMSIWAATWRPPWLRCATTAASPTMRPTAR